MEAHLDPELAGHRGQVGLDLGGPAGRDLEPDPVYAMHFELEVPAGRAGEVEADLAAVAGELGVQVSFHPDDADLL